jgi:hypothetical protein
MTKHRPAFLAMAALAVLPASASAATLEDTAGSGPAADGYLVYTAAKGERNRLTVANSVERGIVFTDPGARIHRVKGDFGKCSFSADRHRAVCAEPSHEEVIVHLGDRDDTIRFKGDNAGDLGPAARTQVKNAARLADAYVDLQGGNSAQSIVDGGRGDDVLRGTAQHDRLDGGRGADRVDGGMGDDHIVDRPDGAADTLLGGRGIDTVDGEGRARLTIDLQAGTFSADRETDTLDSIERARGGPGDDRLKGSGGSDGLFGDAGSDRIDGRGGNDYLGGDLGPPLYGSFGKPGRDKLTGGAGNDVLDGRDGSDGTLTPTDRLVCGKGADRIVALQDDLADPSCESSAFGVFSGDVYYGQPVNFAELSGVAPVARGADGAPTYTISCDTLIGNKEPDCFGRVQLERPPVTGREKELEVLGTGTFGIRGGTKNDVPVTLNAAGKAALAQPGATASVHVVIGAPGDPQSPPPNADFGWQQVLGPP